MKQQRERDEDELERVETGFGKRQQPVHLLVVGVLPAEHERVGVEVLENERAERKDAEQGMELAAGVVAGGGVHRAGGWYQRTAGR